MYGPETARAAVDLHQLTMAMMPRRWSCVRFEVERDAATRFQRLTKLDAEIGEGGGAMPPALGRDQGTLVAAMNGALATIAGDLGEGWLGLGGRMDRAADGSAALVLLGPDGAEQSRLTLAADTVDSFVLSDVLFDAFDATRAAAQATQLAFQQAIQGFKQWDAVTDKGELSFVLADGKPWSMRGQAIGSWARDGDSWMWAWANDSVAPAFSVDAGRVRDVAKGRRGLAAMTTPKFAAKQAFAVELALHVGAIMGARGVFPGPYGGGLVFIAAMT